MKMILGWAGNFNGDSKQFKLAAAIAAKLGYPLDVAGPRSHSSCRPHSAMREFYQGIHLLFITSLHEAHPRIVYESLACGTPVVMERSVGDCYVECVKGIRYYDGFEPESIMEALRDAYERREELSDAGVRCIQEEWSWDLFIDNYVKMFKFVADSPKVLIAVNGHAWSYDLMAQATQKYVPLPIDIFYLGDYRNPMQFDFSPYNVVLNHIWHRLSMFQHPYYNMGMNIASVANRIHKPILGLFKAIANRSVAISTVSKAMMPELEKYGKPLFHCTEGVDTELFYP